MIVQDQESPLVEERRRAILALLRQQGRVLSSQLSGRFGTSEDTIRRDLRDLAADGLLRRVHGGALPVGPRIETVAARLAKASPARRAIGAAAAKLVQNGQVVILDAGSTGVEVARALDTRLSATFLTNSLAAATELARYPGIEVVFLGGSVDKVAGSTFGATVLEMLSRVQADLCLMGVQGLDPRIGFTAAHFEEAAVKRLMLARAGEAVALATADKLETAAPHVVAPAGAFHQLLTDSSANARCLAEFRAMGIQVHEVRA
jgi:DeoR/GlpR family transcriptional regulator of sugar metabolism